MLRQNIDFTDDDISLSILTTWKIRLSEWEKQCTATFNNNQQDDNNLTTSLTSEINAMMQLVDIRIAAENMINKIDTFCKTNNFDPDNFELPLSVTLATLLDWQQQLNILVPESMLIVGRSTLYERFGTKRNVLTLGYTLIATRISSLYKGEFFLSIDEVWEKGVVDYRDYRNNLDRTEQFPPNLDGYNKTKTNAESSQFIDADDVSTHASIRNNENYQVDVFGSRELGTSQMAHLLPASELAALTWYPVVPWVLPSMVNEKIYPLDSDDYWELVRKCILGTKPVGDSKSKQESKPILSSKATKMSSPPKKKPAPIVFKYNTRKSNKTLSFVPQKDSPPKKKSDSTQHGNKNKRALSSSANMPNKKKARSGRRNNSQNSSEQTQTTKRRITGTGIKHFLTNIIRLKAQVQYYDSLPCLLIIPILSLEQVRNWKGEGYSAIVLAGEWRSPESTARNAAAVYAAIGAHLGGINSNFLASRTEIVTATDLLASMIQMVAQKCLPEGKNRFNKKNGDAYKRFKKEQSTTMPVEPDIALDSKNLSPHASLPNDKIDVPRLADKINEGVVRVRKIEFREVPMKKDSTSTIASVSTNVDSTSLTSKSPKIAISSETDLTQHDGVLDRCTNSASLPACPSVNQTSNSSDDDSKLRKKKQSKSKRAGLGDIEPYNFKSDDEGLRDSKPSPTSFEDICSPQKANSKDEPDKANLDQPVAPEPVLLAVKAVTNWMRRNFWFLVAGAGPKVYDIDNGSTDVNDELRAWNWPSSPQEFHNFFSHDPPVPEITIRRYQTRA